MLWAVVGTAWLVFRLTAPSVSASPVPSSGCIVDYCPAVYTIFPARSFTPAPTTPLKTNAQRLARGVKLIPPQRRTPVTPTPLRRFGLSPRASALPVAKIVRRGVVAVKNETNHLVGYIGRRTHRFGNVLIAAEARRAAELEYEVPTLGGVAQKNTSLWMTDWAKPDFPLLGLVFASENATRPEVPRQPELLTFAGFEEPGSSPGEVPTFLSNSYTSATRKRRAGESSIWTVREDGKIEAIWTNVDGSHVKLHIFAIKRALFAIANFDDEDAENFSLYTLHFEALDIES